MPSDVSHFSRGYKGKKARRSNAAVAAKADRLGRQAGSTSTAREKAAAHGATGGAR